VIALRLFASGWKANLERAFAVSTHAARRRHTNAKIRLEWINRTFLFSIGRREIDEHGAPFAKSANDALRLGSG
jgi:hypothetical protein